MKQAEERKWTKVDYWIAIPTAIAMVGVAVFIMWNVYGY